MFRILLATDGSPDAFKAARRAADLCAALKEASVTILYVQDLDSASLGPIATFTGFGGVAVRPKEMDWSTLKASLESAAKEALEETQKTFAGTGIPVRLQTEIGKPAEVICRVGERGGFNLVVLGSRGLGGIGGLVLGSVSNQVIHRSRVPVLVVR